MATSTRNLQRDEEIFLVDYYGNLYWVEDCCFLVCWHSGGFSELSRICMRVNDGYRGLLGSL